MKTASQLRQAEGAVPGGLKGTEVIALSPSVWHECRKAGWNVKRASEYVSESEFHAILKVAKELARSWYAGAEAGLEYRGLNLGDLVRIDNLVFFRELLAARIVIRRIIADHRPQETYICTGSSVPCLRSHRFSGAHSVCEAVFRRELAQEGLDAVVLSHAPAARWPWIPLSFKRRVRALLPSRAVGPEHRGRKAPTGDGPLPLPARRAETLVLAIGEEIDLLSLEPVVDSLNDSGAYDAWLVNADDSVVRVNDRSGLSSIDVRKLIQLTAWDCHPEDSLRMKQSLRRLRREFRAARTLPEPYGRLLDSGELAFHFDAIWSWVWPDAIDHIDRVASMLATTRPHAVMVAGIERYRDRAAVKLAKARGMATLAIPHGFVGDIECFDYETDHFLAWGDASKTQLVRELKKDPATIKVLGPLHLYRSVVDCKPGPVTPRSVGSQKRTLLAITNRMGWVCFDPTSEDETTRSWMEVMAFLRQKPEVELLIKPSPGGYDLDHWYAELAGMAQPPNAKVVADRRLEEVAAEVDAVVVMFEATTAVFVAVGLDLPTVVIRSGWRVRPDRIDAIGLPGGLVTIDRIGDIAGALERLLWDEAFRASCLAHCRRFLRHNVFPKPGDCVAHTRNIFDMCLRRTLFVQ